jgi:hypothetical protein
VLFGLEVTVLLASLGTPDEAHGRVLAVTEKVFPAVTGDGTASVEELVRRDPRARHLAETYLGRLGARRTEVLPAGRSLTLVEAGNHAQGCIFRDGMHLLTPQLERRIDEMSRKLAGFFIGRYDLRCPSLDDLRAGRGLQVVELNGAASEATSVYDARNSLWTAYRTLCRQWGLVFAVGAANRARGGVARLARLPQARRHLPGRRLIPPRRRPTPCAP